MKLIVVRSGSALLFSEFGARHVKVGDVVLLAAQTLCGAEPEGSVSTTTIYLDRDYVIDQVFWQYAAQFCDRHNARDFFDAHYSTPAQIVRIGEDRAEMLMPWLDELAALSLDGPRPERFLRAQAMLFSVLDVIVPFVTTTAGTTKAGRGSAVIPSAPRHRQFRPLRIDARHVAQLIRDDPARRWTVQELAEAVHLSPSQLRRVFVEAFGKAPIAYLTMVRTERIAKLLRSTELPVKQIAAQVGWVDAEFAARQFRRSLGVTPSAYRRFVCAPNLSDGAQRAVDCTHAPATS
ncbi:AraC family transcriptional regulator [Microbacterium rhizomatis]|uniref:AraC family transcriptional regulator n=1 Tax=Microbacterium rhizomatis TaxID=1631477 RepID=UPI001B860F03|nr:AraC family transcriptional regulator [Microbacterium rhizomatis]